MWAEEDVDWDGALAMVSIHPEGAGRWEPGLPIRARLNECKGAESF